MTPTRKLTALALLALVTGCRGGISEQPPVHLVDDMDIQPKLKAQSESGFAFWADKRGMRLPVPGTVSQAEPREGPFHTGKNADGSFVKQNPLPKTLENVTRGRERFEIHCAPCHDRAGSGNGMVIQRQPEAFPVILQRKLHLARDPVLRQEDDGALFQAITTGKNATGGQTTMPAYGHQIEPADRWAIVHYLRVLQSRAN
jgi:mono/diheme cytochrome c family protein